MSKTILTFEFDVSGLTYRQRQAFESAVVVQGEASDDNQDHLDDYPDIPLVSVTCKEEYSG